MSIYQELILEHFRHPHNRGVLAHATHQAELNNPLCGDQIKMQVEVVDGAVQGIVFAGTGCAISQAAASLLTDAAKNRPIAELEKMTKDDIMKLLGIELSPNRLKCALLSLEVLQKAINQLQ